MEQRFILAPMDGFLTGLTVLCWSIPTFFIGSVVWDGRAWPLAAVGVFLILIYASVWVWWRPSCFRLTETSLDIVFPGRVIHQPLDQICACRLLDKTELKERYGNCYRVGAGGLWGGFGWLRTSTKEWLEFYISRQSDYLLIERQDHIPLLITPREREKMLAALQRVKAGPG